MQNRLKKSINSLVTFLKTSCVPETTNEQGLNKLIANYGFEYYTLKSPDLLDIINNDLQKNYGDTDNINKLQLIVIYADTHKQYILFRYESGKLGILEISQKDIKNIIDIFTVMNAQHEILFRQVGAINLGWHKLTQDVIYQSNPQAGKIYPSLHEMIIDHLMPLISNPNQEFNIIDGGCGVGDFLELLNRKLTKDKGGSDYQHVKLFGFDFNKDNITKCGSDSNINYFVGDLTNFQDVMHNVCKLQQSQNQETSNILVLSGSLTRFVMKDLFMSLEVLKSIAATKKIDYLIGGGVGEQLFTRHIAKQVGYKLIQQNKGRGNFFYYQRMTTDEILKNHFRNIEKKNLLDLSFHPNPAEILSNKDILKLIKPNTILDLSYLPYNSDLRICIDNILKIHPDVCLIYQNECNTNVKSFANDFLGRAKVIAVNQKYFNEKNIFSLFKNEPRSRSWCRFNVETPPVKSQDKEVMLSEKYTEMLRVYYGNDKSINYVLYRSLVKHYLMDYLDVDDPLHNFKVLMDEFLKDLKNELLSCHEKLLIDTYGEQNYVEKVENIYIEDVNFRFHFSCICNEDIIDLSKEYIDHKISKYVKDAISSNDNNKLACAMVLMMTDIKFYGNLIKKKDQSAQRLIAGYGYTLISSPPEEDFIDLAAFLSRKLEGSQEPEFLYHFCKHKICSRGKSINNPSDSTNEATDKILRNLWDQCKQEHRTYKAIKK